MPRLLYAIPYYGGKSLRGRNGKVGRWIAKNLPRRKGYAEPCCGMLGVLLQRYPSKIEIANDADWMVINWWKCVRDHYEEFAHLVEHTPLSRAEFYEALWMVKEHKDNPCYGGANLKLGWAFQTVVRNSLFHGAHGSRNFGLKVATDGGLRAIPEIRRLAQRLRPVQLETRDAAETLKSLADRNDWAIFFDPPYLHADTSPYGHDLADRGEIADLLTAQKGAVAVSGYDGEWDGLGWHRTDFAAKVVNAQGGTSGRMEQVWTNFEPVAQRQRLF